MFKYLGATLAGALLLAATSANALPITQQRVVDGDPNFVVTFDDFDQFNSAGTLLSVTLSWNITVSGTVTADGCDSFNDCLPGAFTLSLAGFDVLAGASDSDTASSSITGDEDSEQTGSVSTTIVGSQSFANLADFIGAGLVAGGVDVDGNYDGFPFGIDGTRSGLVTLTYEYRLTSDVPEPGVLALFATGLGLLGFAGWRRVAARR